jgi:hypothetical protein
MEPAKATEVTVVTVLVVTVEIIKNTFPGPKKRTTSYCSLQRTICQSLQVQIA